MAVDWADKQSVPILVLGEGSNVVISDRGFDGLVLKMNICGIEILCETDEIAEVVVGAGEDWDSFVEYSVAKGWWGIENMSLIPGKIGALPVQNVGAYGQDARQTISSIRVYDTLEKKYTELHNKDCNFSRRKSIFNTTAAGRYVIVAVTFRFSKIPTPCLKRANLNNELQKEFGAACIRKMKKEDLPLLHNEIRKAVIRLRSNGEALPPPNKYASVGSFFQTASLSINDFLQTLKSIYQNIGLGSVIIFALAGFKHLSHSGIRISTPLLIKTCKAQNISKNGVCLYEPKPTVLINKGMHSSSTDVLLVAGEVRKRIYQKTRITLPVEPVFIGFTSEELMLLETNTIKELSA